MNSEERSRFGGGFDMFSFARKDRIGESQTCKEQLSGLGPLTQNGRLSGSELKKSNFSLLEKSILCYNNETKEKSQPLMQKLVSTINQLKKEYQMFVQDFFELFQDLKSIFEESMVKVNAQIETIDIQKASYKQKYEKIYFDYQSLKKENQKLKTNLNEWEEAKSRRKKKLEAESQSKNSFKSKQQKQNVDISQFMPQKVSQKVILGESSQFLSNQNSRDLHDKISSQFVLKDSGNKKVNSQKREMNLRRKVESACSTFSQKGRKLSVVSLMK